MDEIVHSAASIRIFMRKWLPPQLRKLSQSKGEKLPNDKSLLKKPSEKNLRLPQKHAEELAEQTSGTATPGSGASTSGSVGQMPPQFPNVTSTTTQQQQHDYEPDEEAGLELPPPMKPIQEPHLIANGPPAFPKDLKESSANLTSTGKIDGKLSEIEQIVRMSREQHESNSRVDGAVTAEEAAESAATNGRSHDDDRNNTGNSDSQAAALKQRQMVMQELVSTEDKYVKDLEVIVNGYMKEIHNKEIPRPVDLQGGKMDLVFNNITEIYEWHRDKFLRALRHCQRTPADLGPLIENSSKKFNMYYYFCSNKILSEYIVNEHYDYFEKICNKLGEKDRMKLSDLLIKPVQRITKYELLIKQLLRETQRAGLQNEVASLVEAYNQMRVVVKTVDDMTLVLRGLHDFDGEITAQGNLLLQGTLQCSIDAGQRQRELQVFLFQQIIIFADIQKAKTQYTDPIYKYRTHIQLNHMHLERMKESDYSFRIRSTDPNKPTVAIDCQAASAESYAEWLGMLNKILEQQSALISRLVNPLNN
ncbi:rho guanine nucleotide exchange factor 25 isoform X3 [Drosophila sulfurigaster albostrigata]|uniref:rho guanine nucleotide exchange factor 25 isoform X3 n=1 Tax=Drosophila sulfurigaster albostrigata TaxID=89887 RepID=UPI002D21AC00|nr:rho guanine nucleotide exchange factor 25 isoform X3 [Drosophila sulfurigaster albostrigata]